MFVYAGQLAFTPYAHRVSGESQSLITWLPVGAISSAPSVIKSLVVKWYPPQSCVIPIRSDNGGVAAAGAPKIAGSYCH